MKKYIKKHFLYTYLMEYLLQYLLIFILNEMALHTTDKTYRPKHF